MISGVYIRFFFLVIFTFIHRRWQTCINYTFFPFLWLFIIFCILFTLCCTITMRYITFYVYAVFLWYTQARFMIGAYQIDTVQKTGTRFLILTYIPTQIIVYNCEYMEFYINMWKNRVFILHELCFFFGMPILQDVLYHILVI